MLFKVSFHFSFSFLFKGFLDSVKRGQEQVLGDLSMILCDPYAINFLATSAMKILQHLINNEALPRVCFYCCNF